MTSEILGSPPERLADALRCYTLPAQLSLPTIIAEIGCNHGGQIDIAKQMIVVAVTCGADVAKFQKRTPKELLTQEQYNAPYDNPHSFGRTYGEHREALEFDASTHAYLKRYCEEHAIVYSASVWDMTSAREIAALAPQFIKIPSACNNNIKMLEFLRDDYAGGVHISTGMSTKQEVDDAVRVFERCPERVTLYACTSGYPVPFKDICILELVMLARDYKASGRVGAIGFSGHHKGVALDVLAPILGATFIERHFTLDRAAKGSDHAASLEPPGLARVARNAKQVAESWSAKPVEILPIELPQRAKLKYQLRHGATDQA